MKAIKDLPEGYKEIYSVDFQKNRKTALKINGIALIITVLMIVPMLFIVPISTLFESGGFIGFLIKLAAFIVFTAAYMVLHELVHGIAMKICGTKKVKYGFTGIYAYAGSSDHYGKKAYIFIALAPIVFFGIILAVVNALVPRDWFWVIYIIQVTNISGAAGDLFVTFKFSRFPKDILVKDHGVGMRVYSKQ